MAVIREEPRRNTPDFAALHPGYTQRTMETSLNQQITMKLAQAADLLEQQGANPFRVSAYRRASDTVSRLQPTMAILLKRNHA